MYLFQMDSHGCTDRVDNRKNACAMVPLDHGLMHHKYPVHPVNPRYIKTMYC